MVRHSLCLVKREKQVVLKILFLLCILLAAGCSSEKALIQSSVIGEWYNPNLGCLSFNADGTVSLSMAGGTAVEGTYKVASRSRLKMTWIGVVQGESVVEIVRVESVTEDELVLAKDEGSLRLCRNGSSVGCSCEGP